MFETLPIFKDSLDCQLFMFMTFFVSRKHLLTCKLGTFFGQSAQVDAIHGHDVTPFSPCTVEENFFHKIHNKNNSKCNDKLSLAEKVRIMAW
jgi:hypothetical protein